MVVFAYLSRFVIMTILRVLGNIFEPSISAREQKVTFLRSAVIPGV